VDAPSAQPELPGFDADGPREWLAFRQTDYDVPFWARNNSHPGRWNRAGDPPTQYWSLHPDGAWAEFLHQEELGDPGDLTRLRRPIWVCRIRVAPLVDLRRDDERDRWAVPLDALTDSDWSTCQRLAGTLREQRVAGVIAPSAVIDGHDNLTLFGPRRAIALHRKPVLHSTVPAAMVARGAPDPALLTRVRRGTAPGAPEPLF
jgi:RES domain-containing protein